MAQAGFRFLEVHAAHGYLIHSFYSPIGNRRTDGYGGGRRGRMRLALEIAEAVRGEWPEDRPLSFRLSCVDGIDGGWAMEDTIALARELAHRGVDAIDCSSRGVRGATSLANLEASRRPARAGYQVPYAEELRRETGIPDRGLDQPPRPGAHKLREGVGNQRWRRQRNHSIVAHVRCAPLAETVVYPDSISAKTRRTSQPIRTPLSTIAPLRSLGLVSASNSKIASRSCGSVTRSNS